MSNSLYSWVDWYLNECNYQSFDKYINENIHNLCHKYMLEKLTHMERETLIKFFNQTFKPKQKIN